MFFLGNGILNARSILKSYSLDELIELDPWSDLVGTTSLRFRGFCISIKIKLLGLLW